MQYALVQYDISLSREESSLAFFTMQGVSFQSTLAEVYQILQSSREGAVYVYENEPSNITGVITWNMLRSYLHKAQY